MLNDSDENFWFHHRPDFIGYNPSLYKKLISEAEYSIKVWDPHFHIDLDCIIFSNIKQNISIQILTQVSLNGRYSGYKENILEKMRDTIPKEKNTSFCIGIIDKYNHYKRLWEFHDRFLIIDENQVYIVGGSVEYNHISKMSSGIYKVTNTSSSDFIVSLFIKYWNATEKHPVTTQLLHI